MWIKFQFVHIQFCKVLKCKIMLSGGKLWIHVVKKILLMNIHFISLFHTVIAERERITPNKWDFLYFLFHYQQINTQTYCVCPCSKLLLF